jgi:hypothetical protein
MYDHGISTVMLGEVCGMADDGRKRRIDKALARAVRLILDAQRVPKASGFAGGWRYTPTAADSDLSVTGWQLMALRAAANCGATVPRSALDAGLVYVRNSVSGGRGLDRSDRAARRGSPEPTGFAYQPGGPPNAARTGTGVLVLELLGEHGSEEARQGGEYLLRHPPARGNAEFYYYAAYYVSQAVNQLGGRYWDEVYPKIRDDVLRLRRPDGSFGPGSMADVGPGPAYCTSMACLALCVPDRYLPLYQR